jgi:uncharacterized protein
LSSSAIAADHVAADQRAEPRRRMAAAATLPCRIEGGHRHMHPRTSLSDPRLGRRAALLLPFVAAACASPNPTLYTLAPVPGQVRGTGARLIELRAIVLARYLERPQIVRSSEDYRLDVLGNDWWGEPLDAMLGRVMVQDLMQRLPNATVFAESGAVSGSPEATVGINILRMDLDRGGRLVLNAQVSVTKRSPVTRDVALAVTPSGAGTTSLVAAMSIALGQLADQVADMLSDQAVPVSSGKAARSRQGR